MTATEWFMRAEIEKLEEENKKLKEYNENLIRADKKKTEYIDKLEKENKEENSI